MKTLMTTAAAMSLCAAPLFACWVDQAAALDKMDGTQTKATRRSAPLLLMGAILRLSSRPFCLATGPSFIAHQPLTRAPVARCGGRDLMRAAFATLVFSLLQ